MKLCIAEKPSVAKDLASILGANARHDGYFEGNGYFVSWTFRKVVYRLIKYIPKVGVQSAPI